MFTQRIKGIRIV